MYERSCEGFRGARRIMERIVEDGRTFIGGC